MKELIKKIKDKKARIGLIGLGYVGLPLTIRFSDEGFKVYGFDIDANKVNRLKKGESYIHHIPSSSIKKMLQIGTFEPTADFQRLSEVDVIVVCVPTPLTSTKTPQLDFLLNTAESISCSLRRGQLVSIESTTYPGTTDELILPILSRTGLKVGKDFFLVFSPEREDPGNKQFTTKNIPKVVGGITPKCLEMGKLLYSQIVDKVVPLSSTKAAEMTKLLENIYRSVNVALVNELKILTDRMGIDIWEVIEAASTKPFGFSPFYPGPGLGGHCIPIDPFYLSWKAREFDFTARFIELAGEINTLMPYYVINKLIDALNERKKSLKGSRILFLGVAYKKDVDDMRESPALPIMRLALEKGAEIEYNDPFIPKFPELRKYSFDFVSHQLTPEYLNSFDAVVIITDHSAYNYDWIVKHSKLVIDTRNATKNVKIGREKIVKA